MATPLGIKYTDKNRPRGFYLVNGKEKYWDGKKYKDKPSGSDFGFLNVFKQSPEAKARIEKLRIQTEIQQKGRGVRLPEEYAADEKRQFAAAARTKQETTEPTTVNEKDPDTPSKPVVEPPAEEPVETTPVPAAEITKPPTQRELKIKQARTKYKDSPFKQWAHANQALARALKPGQVGYKEVQEYFKEQENLSSAGKVGWQGRQGMR